jgi:hypothetical protein
MIIPNTASNLRKSASDLTIDTIHDLQMKPAVSGLCCSIDQPSWKAKLVSEVLLACLLA